MSPRRKKTPEEIAMEKEMMEMTEEMLYTVSGGISRMRAKCPVSGCTFECGRMTELNAHMKLCHPERC